MNIGSDSFEIFRCDQAMQIGLNMTNLHKIFGAFSNGSISMSADGEDADTVQFIFESAKESAAAKSKRMKKKKTNPTKKSPTTKTWKMSNLVKTQKARRVKIPQQPPEHLCLKNKYTNSE